MRLDLSGSWTVTTNEVTDKAVILPGSLDENNIGHQDTIAKPWHPDIEERSDSSDSTADNEKRIATRLTRKVTYEGPAHFTKILSNVQFEDKRVFLIAERARALSLNIDSKEVSPTRGSLSSPYVFEITNVISSDSLIELTTDNSYPKLPYKDIVFSSAATDETQTNWNGIIGECYLEIKEQTFIDNVRIYPCGNTIDVVIGIDYLTDLSCNNDLSYTLKLSGQCLQDSLVTSTCTLNSESKENPHYQEFVFTGLSLSPSALLKKWDEYEGNLHTISVSLMDCNQIVSQKEASFGIREISYDESGRLTLNGRRIFLRSETNCALFPATGHPPMDENSWEKIMLTYRSYGVNCIRFHSWCPPKAAFDAADRLGMLIQPELSNWNPRDAFSSAESRSYYETELSEILMEYCNHPSFVMLTLGNELHSDDDGVKYMHHLLTVARSFDSTRLYAWGSNNFYGEKGTDSESDFYSSMQFNEMPLRECGNKGIINTTYANACGNLSDALRALKKEYNKPVISFEVGQYEILPDLGEIEQFNGVLRADNLDIVRDKVRQIGMTEEDWSKRVAATGEMSLMAYREEVECVLRTPELSGISLLGLQDFTGQGTALVGMLNSHMVSKPYPFSSPERFERFFRAQSILILLDRFTYCSGETLHAEIKFANYGKREVSGNVTYEITASDKALNNISFSETISQNVFCPIGELSSIGFINVKLDCILGAQKLDLCVTLKDSGSEEVFKNSYPIWVYPDETPKCPPSVYETTQFDAKAINILDEGGVVYLTPPSTKEALPHSVKAQYTTDFWSVKTFPEQEGTMGQLINKSHPVFEDFPTESYTQYQWWPMASQRALILPKYMDTIITEMDSFATMRPMTQLMELRSGNGRILISTMGLQDLQKYPEARALLNSIYRYLASEEFNPKDVMSYSEIESLFVQ